MLPKLEDFSNHSQAVNIHSLSAHGLHNSACYFRQLRLMPFNANAITVTWQFASLHNCFVILELLSRLTICVFILS